MTYITMVNGELQYYQSLDKAFFVLFWIRARWWQNSYGLIDLSLHSLFHITHTLSLSHTHTRTHTRACVIERESHLNSMSSKRFCVYSEVAATFVCFCLCHCKNIQSGEESISPIFYKQLFLYINIFHNFSLITVWLCNFFGKEYRCKSCL